MDSSKYPVWVLWNFGYQCNMNCLHCYSRGEAIKEYENMTVRQAEDIANKIIKAKVLHVHFGGGEPLMRNDFFSNVLRLATAGLTISLSTNGWFLDQEIADKIAETSINIVALSIHGADSDTHDSFTRCQGAFEKLIKARMCLKKAGVKTKFVIVLCKKTTMEVVEILHLAEDLEIEQVQFYPMKIVGNAGEEIKDLWLSADDWKNTYDIIFKEAKLHPMLNIDFGLDNDPMVAGYLNRKALPCPCGRFSVVIKPSGDVSACSLAMNIVGNVHQRSLLDIWQNSEDLLAIRRGKRSPCESIIFREE